MEVSKEWTVRKERRRAKSGELAKSGGEQRVDS